MRKRSLPCGPILAPVFSLFAWLALGCSSTGDPADSTAMGSSGNGSGGSSSGATSGGNTGTSGNAGAGTSGGAQGTSGTGGSGQGTAGTAGTGQGTAGAAVGPGGGVRTGMSAGCNTDPPGDDSSEDYVLHEVAVNGLDPIYLQGGELYEASGKYSAALRPYGLRLPTGYDSSKPYAVTFGGGGCGGNAQNFAGNPGGGLQMAGNGMTIQVGLSYIAGCFADGGPSIDNRTDSPEEPYFRAVMAELEAHYCVDLSKVFVGGFSSGAWEAFTLGCAAADLVRGIGTDEGGFRTMHPECKGPVAAVLVAGEDDTENPIGPLDPNNEADKGAIGRLGSLGSAPGRDNILMRNGCVGTATVPYEDAKYGACVKYSGCPAAYPVVWCALPGVGHNNSTYMGNNYSPGPMWSVLSALPPP